MGADVTGSVEGKSATCRCWQCPRLRGCCCVTPYIYLLGSRRPVTLACEKAAEQSGCRKCHDLRSSSMPPRWRVRCILISHVSFQGEGIVDVPVRTLPTQSRPPAVVVMRNRGRRHMRHMRRRFFQVGRTRPPDRRSASLPREWDLREAEYDGKARSDNQGKFLQRHARV